MASSGAPGNCVGRRGHANSECSVHNGNSTECENAYKWNFFGPEYVCAYNHTDNTCYQTDEECNWAETTCVGTRTSESDYQTPYCNGISDDGGDLNCSDYFSTYDSSILCASDPQDPNKCINGDYCAKTGSPQGTSEIPELNSIYIVALVAIAVVAGFLIMQKR